LRTSIFQSYHETAANKKRAPGAGAQEKPARSNDQEAGENELETHERDRQPKPDETTLHDTPLYYRCQIF